MITKAQNIAIKRDFLDFLSKLTTVAIQPANCAPNNIKLFKI